MLIVVEVPTELAQLPAEVTPICLAPRILEGDGSSMWAVAVVEEVRS